MLLLVQAAWALPQVGPCIHAPRRAGRPGGAIDSLVSETHPIRVHIEREQDRAFAEQVVVWAEESWRIQVDELGFRPPDLPDSAEGDELDIYLTITDGPWSAWAEAEGFVDSQPDDGYMSTPAYILLPRQLDLEYARSYVAHEFNHTLQWATDFTEPTYPIWEAVASASQEYTIQDADPQWDYDIFYFQEAPWAPVITGDGYTLWDLAEVGWGYEYGAVFWILYLDRTYGTGDGKLLAELWEATANEGWALEPDVVDAVETVTGETLGEFLNGLALARWLIAEEWDERGLVEAEHWSEAEKVPALTVPQDDLGEISWDPAPMVTGQGFVEIPISDPSGHLEVTVSTSRGLRSALAGFTFGSERGEYGDTGDAPQLDIPLEGVDSVVVALTNLGRTDWDGDNNSYVPGDQVLTVVHVPASHDPDDPEETPRACGCRSAGSLGVLGWLPLLLAFRRR